MSRPPSQPQLLEVVQRDELEYDVHELGDFRVRDLSHRVTGEMRRIPAWVANNSHYPIIGMEIDLTFHVT